MIAHRSRTGLTLLELVVVLAILATLTLVAVVSTDTVVDQGRYDVTRRTLDNVQTAVLGELNQTDADGTRAVTGFVADTGRLPKAVGSDPAMQLAELWSNPNNLPLFGVAASTFDADVKLLAGWRGPYLRLPPQPAGNVKMLDGWGNPFLLLRADQTPVAATDPIVHVRSGGGPGSPYDQTLVLSQPFFPESHTGSVTGAVSDSDPVPPNPETDLNSPYVVDVVLFVPDFAQPDGVDERHANPPPSAANGYSFTFTDIPIGPKVLRAYQTYTPTGGNQTQIRSDIIHLRVPAGGTARNIAIDLRPPPPPKP